MRQVERLFLLEGNVTFAELDGHRLPVRILGKTGPDTVEHVDGATDNCINLILA